MGVISKKDIQGIDAVTAEDLIKFKNFTPIRNRERESSLK